jgi:hypothetical protein
MSAMNAEAVVKARCRPRDQAVALVGPPLVKAQAGKKRLMALRDDPDIRVGQEAAHRGRRPAALPGIRGKNVMNSVRISPVVTMTALART